MCCFRYDSVTSIQKVWNDTLYFPMITVCNVNNMAKSKVKSELPSVYEYLIKRNQESHSVPHENITDMNRSMIEVFEKTMVRVDETFLQCRWQNYVVPCDKYIQPLLTDLNFCYSIHTHKVLQVIQPGPDFGLGLTVDIHQEEYLMTPASLGAGVFVLVHDQDSYPVMKQRSVSLAPGFEHYLSVQREEIRRLKQPYSRTDCRDTRNPPNTSTSHLSYTFEECLARCALDTIYRHCQCTPYTRDPATTCKLSDLVTCGNYQSSHKIYDSDCNCEPACQEINYNVQISSLAFPSELGMNELQKRNISRKTFHDIKSNVMVLRIYFGGMEYTLTEQQPAMSTGQLIADIGGQLGLFLGASLITVVEFLEFFILTAWYCLSKGGELPKAEDTAL